MGLDTVDLVLRTEETFTIDLPDDECALIITVGDLYRAVLTKLNLPDIPAEIGTRARNHALARFPQLHHWTTPDIWATLRGLIPIQDRTNSRSTPTRSPSPPASKPTSAANSHISPTTRVPHLRDSLTVAKVGYRAPRDPFSRTHTQVR